MEDKLVTVHVDIDGVKGGRLRLRHADFNSGMVTFTSKSRTLIVPIDKLAIELITKTS